MEPVAGTGTDGPGGESRPAWASTWAVLRVILVIVAVACALWVLYRLRSLILLVVLSIFFAYLIAPLVAFVGRPFVLRRHTYRLGTAPAVGIVYLLLVAVLTLALAWVVPRISDQATQMMAAAPEYLKSVEAHSEDTTGILTRLPLPPAARDTAQRAFATLLETIEGWGRSLLMALVGLIAYLPWLVLIPILAFFLLKDAEAIREGALRLLPAGRLRANGTELFSRINVALAAYIRAQMLACLLVGTVVAAGFALLGVPYAMTLGVTAGLAEFIPMLGPLVVAFVAALIAAVHLPMLALWVVLFLGVLRVTEDYVVYPRLVGHGIHLHPLAVILAVLAGAELAGVPGVFLSVPVVAVLSAGYRQYRTFGEEMKRERAGDPRD
jgi:predicted PurR-regulated permease PerM